MASAESYRRRRLTREHEQNRLDIDDDDECKTPPDLD